MSLNVIRHLMQIAGALAGLTAVFSITLHMAVKSKLDIDVPRQRLLFLSFVSVVVSGLCSIALIYYLPVQHISSLGVATLTMLFFVAATLAINPVFYAKLIQCEKGVPIGFTNALMVAAFQSVTLLVLAVLAIALVWLQFFMRQLWK